MNSTIGIDVSKDKLDVFDLVGLEHHQVANNSPGLKMLQKMIAKLGASLVIFEASGVYHRELETSLAKNAVPYTKVNPRQARRFAEGEPLMRHWFKHNGDRKDRKNRQGRRGNASADGRYLAA